VGKMNIANRDFVTLESIAGYCMVSRNTVRRWIIDGKLNATKLPSGHFRVSTNDFIAFLEQNDMPLSEELR